MLAKTLEQVLADWRGDAQVLRARGHEHDAEVIEEFADQVREAAHEYLTWLNESEARLRSGRSTAWLRARFANWERQGHAKREGRERRYRMVVIPRRANIDVAYREGKRAGTEDAA